MIELKGVSKTYKTKKGVKTLALDNVSFKFPNKGLFFILGKSGSGKSTLLNILGGLDQYDSGEMIIDSKSTKAFQEKDFDYYRNTYLGFIFQEFHLLEEYNVYDNIILSKKLQKEKVSQVVVDDLLNKVGIAGLGKRRINELSGGQKGRVAIARALIKNPKIILADEPTGNLDAETGIQIFELLKSISKEQLVIVVSHDKEAASDYADGIIEISDGKVISNSVSFHLEEKAQFHSEKSKLPFFSSLKLAYLNLKNHKLKLLFTTLLTFMAVLFFGISLVLTKFDIEESHVKTMKNNNNGYITINRWWDTIFGRSGVSLFYEPEIEEVKNKIGNTPYQLMYWPMENNNRVILEINEENVKPNESFSNFIGLMEINPSFVELKMIKGTMPQKYDEVLFSKSLADIILKYGIKLYNEEKYVQPSSYEDIFQYTYQFGTGYFKITGIVENEEKILFSDNLVFGIPGFVEHLTLKPNTTLPRGEFTIYSKQKEREFDLGTNFNTMNTEISVFDGTEMKSVKSLKENEIVVSEAYLNQLSDGDYNSLKRTYLEKNANVENAHIEFLKNYLKENHSLDEKISLTLYDKIGKREFKTFKNLTIVGISLESDAFYLPDTIFTKIMKKNYKINSMILKETNEEKLRKLLHEFPTSIDNDYSGNTVYSVYFGQFTKSLLNSVTLFFRILSCIFGLFAIMLLTNFITTTIYKSKKEIGILRALGARKKDILGIFLKEGVVIGLMAFLLSVVGLYSIVNFLNEFISRDWSFKMELVIVRPNSLILLFVSVITIIFISSLFTVGKIAKMKPVDAISNK